MDFHQKVQLAIAIGTGFTALGAFIAVFMSIQTAKSLSEQLKLNFFADYTKRYQEIILNLPENINEDSFDFEKLEPKAKDKTLRYMRAYFDLSSEEYYLWKQNYIDNNVWKEWSSGIEYTLTKTAFQEGWRDHIDISTIYYDDLTKFINNILDKVNKKED
ncbi:MAG: hypothetical protein KAI79_19105 [Bacteroidales bacterium]|nr:hypothetical protein [Bacteroidales bacterium]